VRARYPNLHEKSPNMGDKEPQQEGGKRFAAAGKGECTEKTGEGKMYRKKTWFVTQLTIEAGSVAQP
jgi:hypothetical protein